MKRRRRSPIRWKSIQITLATFLALGLSATGAFAYEFRKSITIDRSKISDGSCGATLANFPMLFSVTDSDLRHTSSGGDVTDLGGDDIIFVALDAMTCGGPSICRLDHEIEKYVNTTGELVAWVRLPSVNTSAAASDTIIYIYYGDGKVTSPTENPAGVWDANHAGVWHLHDDFLDSANSNDGANNGSTDTAGQIANGQSFNGTSDYINVGTLGNFGSNLVDATYEFWIKTTQTTRAVALGTYNDGITTAVAIRLNTEANGTEVEDKISNHLRDEDDMELEGSADAIAFNDGGWHQLTIVNRGPSNVVEIYLDGSSLAVNILEAQTPDNFMDFAYGLALGARNLRGTIDQFTNAEFDEFRISDTARTACWIGASYNNQVWPDKAVTPTPDPSPNPDSGFYTVGAEAPVPGYDYRKPITIDRGQISDGSCGATLTDFPILFNSTDPDLRHTSFGGDVTDLGGDDIIFVGKDAATCGAAPPCTLDHEIERYVNNTGELVAWVRIPSLNTAAAASDTVIYVYYGDDSVTSPTENPTGVWVNYAGVWHLEEPVTDDTTGGTHDDSTGAHDGTQNNNGAVTGQIAGAQAFDGSADFVEIADDDTLSFGNGGADSPFSVSAWISGDTASGEIVGKNWRPAHGDEYDFWIHSDGHLGLTLDDSQRDTIGQETVASVSGSWQHVMATYDGSNTSAGIKLYIDGVAQALILDEDGGIYDGMPNTTAPVTIGTFDGGGTSYDFNGSIDEVRISDVARSACWIGASYNNQIWPDKAVTPVPDPSPNPSVGFYGIGAPTAVELVSFTARGLDGAVELSWETGSEMDNLGFHLYRSLSEEGPYERITASLIPGLGSSPAGARYRYVDTGLANGVPYFYQLEDIETTGRTKRHGPVSAIPTVGGASEVDAPVEDEGSESVITYGDLEANDLRVVKRGPYQVVLELTTEGFLAYPEPDGSVRIEIPDYLEVGESGLPQKQTWVEALAGRHVELVSIHERDVETFGLRPSGSEYEIVATPDGVVRLERRARRGVKRKQVELSESARLVSVAFQGEVKKALVEMAPLSWDASRQQLRLAKKLVVTLSFAKRNPDEVVSPDGRRGRLSRRRGKQIARGGVVARLGTQAPGLYAVRYEEIFGRPSRGRRVYVDAAWLRLARLGETVAYHLEPAGSRFGPGSTLYFVSPGAEANPYGDEAVFELELGVAGGARMEVEDASPSGALTRSYLRRDAHEQNRIYQAALFETDEHWMWDSLFAPAVKGYGFSVTAPAPGTDPARLELWLQGGSDFPESPDHHVVIYVNGTPVAEQSWDGKVPHVLDVELGSGVLREGDNLLEVENVGDTGAAYSMVFVDRYAVTYPRQTMAEDGRLEGRWTESGTAEITGLSSRAFLVDTTRAQPVWLAGASSSSFNVLRFRAEAEHDYLVVDEDQLLRPEVRKASATGLKRTSNRAEFLVLGPEAFLEAARPLLEHRHRQGLTVRAVPIEQVYTEFGYGETRPEAIRDFLAYAYHHWSAPSLRYVLLLGDATHDFKNYYGLNVENHVPPLMLETRFLQTGSDPTYAAVNGDDRLPDLAIGRLPAANVEQVRVMVDKIVAYETGGASLETTIALVSDNPDGAGDFHSNAEELADTVLASRTPRHIALEQLGTAATRQAILRTFDEGASVVSYIGHGGIDRWANESILQRSSVDSLGPQSQQPLVLTLNCLNGYFHFPFFDSLSEELVKAEGKGAIAAFSPSGLSLNGPAHLYHQAVLNELFHGDHLRLGDAVMAAQEAYAETGAYPELLSIYHLLGDPALTLR